MGKNGKKGFAHYYEQQKLILLWTSSWIIKYGIVFVEVCGMKDIQDALQQYVAQSKYFVCHSPDTKIELVMCAYRL